MWSVAGRRHAVPYGRKRRGHAGGLSAGAARDRGEVDWGRSTLYQHHRTRRTPRARTGSGSDHLPLLLMAQCFSGGFNQPVIDASRAASTFIASATAQTRQSFMSFEDRNWDSFQRNWIAALAGHDVDGTVIAADPSHARRARITVGEAFSYASTCPARNPLDSPEAAASPDSAAQMKLGEEASDVSAAA